MPLSVISIHKEMAMLSIQDHPIVQQLDSQISQSEAYLSAYK